MMTFKEQLLGALQAEWERHPAPCDDPQEAAEVLAEMFYRVTGEYADLWLQQLWRELRASEGLPA